MIGRVALSRGHSSHYLRFLGLVTPSLSLFRELLLNKSGAAKLETRRGGAGAEVAVAEAAVAEAAVTEAAGAEAAGAKAAAAAGALVMPPSSICSWQMAWSWSLAGRLIPSIFIASMPFCQY
jgi:hypothetical protein